MFIHHAFSLHAYPERYQGSRILDPVPGGMMMTGHAPTSENVAHPVVSLQNIQVKYTVCEDAPSHTI